jgi:hypothetical protein
MRADINTLLYPSPQQLHALGQQIEGIRLRKKEVVRNPSHVGLWYLTGLNNKCVSLTKAREYFELDPDDPTSAYFLRTISKGLQEGRKTIAVIFEDETEDARGLFVSGKLTRNFEKIKLSAKLGFEYAKYDSRLEEILGSDNTMLKAENTMANNGSDVFPQEWPSFDADKEKRKRFLLNYRAAQYGWVRYKNSSLLNYCVFF